MDQQTGASEIVIIYYVAENNIGRNYIWQLGLWWFGKGLPYVYTVSKYEILVDFNMAVAKVDRQTAKFNSPPNFPAIW